MKNLFIAEKPSMGMDIARALAELNGKTVIKQDGYVKVGDDAVTWAVGHLIGLADKEAYNVPEWTGSWSIKMLPIIPETFRYQENPKTSSQLKVVGKLLKQCMVAVNAGDAAREGQLIVDNLFTYFNYKGTAKRLWLQEMNSAHIKSCIKKMQDNQNYFLKYQAARARAEVDWLRGINGTIGYTVVWQDKNKSRETLKIGRVKCPTVGLIVRRDLEIEQFVATDFFPIRAKVKAANGEFWSNLDVADAVENGLIAKSMIDEAGRVSDKAFAAGIAAQLKGSRGIIALCETTPKEVQPPLTFSLGDLQKAAFKAFGFKPEDTLKIAQALYETHKLTSYPRTDFNHLPEGEHGNAEAIIESMLSNFGSAWGQTTDFNMSLKSPTWNSSKIGDHHGIRPTNVKGYDLKKLTADELKIYRMVSERFAMQFLPKYEFDSTVVKVISKGFTFKATGKVDRILGWKCMVKDEEDQEEPGLPKVEQGEPVMVTDSDTSPKKTSPPPRLDAASLLEAMEKAHLHLHDEKYKAIMKEAAGIGTPATRAKIIEEIVGNGYVSLEGKGKKQFYQSTQFGRMMYYAVPEELRYPDLTAYIESQLDLIEKGKLDYNEFMKAQAASVREQVDDIRSGKASDQMKGLDEFVILKKTDAKHTSPRVSKKDKQENESRVLCPKCKSIMKLRESKKGPFFGCTKFPDCKGTASASRQSEDMGASTEPKQAPNKGGSASSGLKYEGSGSVTPMGSTLNVRSAPASGFNPLAGAATGSKIVVKESAGESERPKIETAVDKKRSINGGGSSGMNLGRAVGGSLPPLALSSRTNPLNSVNLRNPLQKPSGAIPRPEVGVQQAPKNEVSNNGQEINRAQEEVLDSSGTLPMEPVLITGLGVAAKVVATDRGGSKFGIAIKADESALIDEVDDVFGKPSEQLVERLRIKQAEEDKKRDDLLAKQQAEEHAAKIAEQEKVAAFAQRSRAAFARMVSGAKGIQSFKREKSVVQPGGVEHPLDSQRDTSVEDQDDGGLDFDEIESRAESIEPGNGSTEDVINEYDECEDAQPSEEEYRMSEGLSQDGVEEGWYLIEEFVSGSCLVRRFVPFEMVSHWSNG